ncbi:MAG: TetR/AcrR family transcriptional regulator [Methylococcales bacterium]|nr:TetR/AcrR family transcriptional regulator [Methylococcales bacterium]
MGKSIELKMCGEGVKETRRDAVENREKILRSAETLFTLHGVENVSMADIAKDASVGKGTLYRRFANKAELCLIMLDSQMIEFQDSILSQFQQMIESEISFVEQLIYYLTQLLHFVEDNSPLLCAIQQGNIVPKAELQLPHFWQAQTAHMLLDQAQKHGEMNADVDIDLMADILLTPARADIFKLLRFQRNYSTDRIVAGLRTLIEGLM